MVGYETSGKTNKGLMALAVFLFLLFVLSFFFVAHTSAIRSVGGFLGVISMLLLRKAKGRGRSAVEDAPGKTFTLSSIQDRPSRLAWGVGVAILVLTGVSFVILHNDAVHGGDALWPLGLFAALMVVGFAYWYVLLGRLFMK